MFSLVTHRIISTNSFLGNYPLLFSHVEYIRALLKIETAHGGKSHLNGRDTKTHTRNPLRRFTRPEGIS